MEKGPVHIPISVVNEYIFISYLEKKIGSAPHTVKFS